MLRFSPRPWALLLTVLSAFAVLLLSLLADVLLTNLRIYYEEYKYELTTMAKWFLFNFAPYNNTLVPQMLLWFALAMLLNLVSTHFRCRDDTTFSIRFLFGLGMCWAALLVFTLLIALICLSPMIHLIIQVRRQPSSMVAAAVPVLSGVFVVISTTMVASAWWARHIHDHRLGTGRCLNCGYDLGATPGRCPECGRDGQTDPNASVHSGA